MTPLQEKLTDIIHKASRAYNGAEVTALVAETEQAFKDAGWLNMNQLGGIKSTTITTPKGNIEFMTGQEWYNRFEKELQQPDALLGHDRSEALDIAKKASGLE